MKEITHEEEMKYLGTAFILPDSFVPGQVDFKSKKNQIVYDALYHLWSIGIKPDIVAVKKYLSDTGRLEEIGISHLLKLIDCGKGDK